MTTNYPKSINTSTELNLLYNTFYVDGSTGTIILTLPDMSDMGDGAIVSIIRTDTVSDNTVVINSIGSTFKNYPIGSTNTSLIVSVGDKYTLNNITDYWYVLSYFNVINTSNRLRIISGSDYIPNSYDLIIKTTDINSLNTKLLSQDLKRSVVPFDFVQSSQSNYCVLTYTASPWLELFIFDLNQGFSSLVTFDCANSPLCKYISPNLLIVCDTESVKICRIDGTSLITLSTDSSIATLSNRWLTCSYSGRFVLLSDRDSSKINMYQLDTPYSSPVLNPMRIELNDIPSNILQLKFCKMDRLLFAGITDTSPYIFIGQVKIDGSSIYNYNTPVDNPPGETILNFDWYQFKYLALVSQKKIYIYQYIITMNRLVYICTIEHGLSSSSFINIEFNISSYRLMLSGDNSPYLEVYSFDSYTLTKIDIKQKFDMPIYKACWNINGNRVITSMYNGENYLNIYMEV